MQIIFTAFFAAHKKTSSWTEYAGPFDPGTLDPASIVRWPVSRTILTPVTVCLKF